MKKLDAISSERFRGQVALVVGGAQGIGRAIAIRLRREGAHVVIVGTSTVPRWISCPAKWRKQE